MAEINDRMLVVSPHYDDAIFSCGRLLAAHDDAVVLTVYSGVPPSSSGLTAWDRDCGFASSAAAMRVREREDDAALECVGASARRLGFLDDQYIAAGIAPRPPATALAQTIDAALDALGATQVVIPLGLFHSDHHRVHDACLDVLRRRPRVKWLGYEDALYRRMAGTVQHRLAALLAAGVEATPAFPGGLALSSTVTDGHALAKREAVAAYASQLQAFGPAGYGDVNQPEHYWHLRAEGTAPTRTA